MNRKASVTLIVAADAAIGPASSPTASNPRIFDFISLPFFYSLRVRWA